MLAGPDSMFLAGGTDLLVSMKQRIRTPGRLVGLGSIAELRGVSLTDDGGLRIGAATTITALTDWASAHSEWAPLGEAAQKTSSPLLRNAGTVGGNFCLDGRCTFYNQPPIFRKRWGPCLKLGGGVCHAVRRSTTCHAVYSGDLAGPLIAWAATATVAGRAGRRTVAVADLFTGDGIQPLRLEPAEMLVALDIPKPPRLVRFSYQKLRLRDTLDFPLLGVSLFLVLDGPTADADCLDARVVLNAAGPAPLLVPEARDLLVGRAPSEKLAAELGAVLGARAHLVGNTAAGAGYRAKMIPVLARRALRDVSP